MGFGDLSDWTLSMRTVSRWFRDLLARELPGLGEDVRFWMFLEYLIFTPFRDQGSDEPCIPSRLVKQIGGTRTAAEFLDEFSAAVVPIAYLDGWSYSEGRCRTITRIDWPPAVAAAIDAEARRGWRKEERVYLRTGNKVTPPSRTRQLAQLEAAAAEFAKDAKEAQKRVLGYLNARHSNQFMSAARKNREQAYAEADKEQSELDRRLLRHRIDQILDQPKPCYKPSRKGNTHRIFGIGESFLTLPSAIRHALLGDWYELDLKCAQFAIMARLWELREINDFLRAGGDVWLELVDYFNGRVDKATLKQCVYSIINGCGKKLIKYQLWYIAEDAWRHFFAHRFIRLLWQARQEAFKSIVRNRGAVDAFGNWIKLDWTTTNRGQKMPVLGRVVAQQSDSHELKLLLPVYYLAEQTDAFGIMLHQHDGLTVAIRDQRRVDRWLNEIKAAVQSEADDLGIHTRLELDWKGDVPQPFIDEIRMQQRWH